MFLPSYLHSCEVPVLPIHKKEELIILVLSLGWKRQEIQQDKLGNSAAAFGL